MENVNNIIIHQPEPGIWYKFPNELPPKSNEFSHCSINILICLNCFKGKKIRPDDIYMDYVDCEDLIFHNNPAVKEAYWQVPKLPLGFYYTTFETFL